MANCYIHTESQASHSCVICGRGICRECSHWAAGDIYLCPNCWQEGAPVKPTTERAGTRAATGLFGAGVSKVLYYAVALIIVVMASWYVYVTFIAPTLLPAGGFPSVPASASPTLWDVLSHYRLLLTVSVSMFIIVLIGGELMLRTGAKQPKGMKTQPALRPAKGPVADARKSSSTEVTKPKAVSDRASQRVSQQAATRPEIQPLTPLAGLRASQRTTAQPEVQPLTQTAQAEPRASQRTISQAEVQPPHQIRLVYCIYCGNKILPTVAFCDRCGKGQK